LCVPGPIERIVVGVEITPALRQQRVTTITTRITTTTQETERIMSIIGWIVLGLISGFIASKIVNKSGEGILLDIVLGIVGAVVGGWLFTTFGMAPVTGVNIYSMIVAIIGAIIVLVVYHALTRRRV
jgi:uncharacterized membrane protein YeaQ/YmgE (transglycosylase-associated protein family)